MGSANNASGEPGRWGLPWWLWTYTAACLTSLGLVLVDLRSVWPFVLTMLLMFPTSMACYCVSLAGGIVLFGPEESLGATTWFAVIWLGGLGFQVGLIRYLWRQRTTNR